ncbi:hypothetical protein I4U23_004683 [Adineta vaga]|nr:hypothetical protein I4U23_004683 [Adineta vaga]
MNKITVRFSIDQCSLTQTTTTEPRKILNDYYTYRVCEINSPIDSHLSKSSLHNFSPPNKVWCPWRADCTQILDQRGQVTIEIDQKISLRFELRLSISENLTNDSYIIYLSVDQHQASIRKIINGITIIVNQSANVEHVLKCEKGKYWLSIDYANLFIKYGQGEVRDLCALFKSEIPSNEQNNVRQIQYAHISFNGSYDMTQLKKFNDKVKLKVGRNPVIDDPALIAVSPTDFSLDYQRSNAAVSITRLHRHCQNLYYDIIKEPFQGDDFLHFYEAIEQSIHSETGWCYKKLREKANRFGKPNILATYLRITIGRNRGTSPGVPYVLEIWSSGHYSPIHRHANTYGIIRVLYGEINVKLYRTLDLKETEPIRETTLYENQVTWLSPGLNQIHKLENKSSNKTCITIQAYEYHSEEINNYEYFDYITNDKESISVFDPVSDINYFKFKELMIAESKSRH